MSLFSFVRPIKSAPVARKRLQALLVHDRLLTSQSDLIRVLQTEVLAAVGRHVTVDPDKVQIRFDRNATTWTLGLDIEIPQGARATAAGTA